MLLAITLLNTSPNKYVELRYALRTMQQNLPATFLVLIGGRPKWCHPDLHIPFPDATDKSQKEANIRDKVLDLCHTTTNPFIFANDDHFIIQPTDLPNYYATIFGGSGGYLRTIANTQQLLPDCYNYDVHCPIIIEPARFIERCSGIWPSWGYCMKTLYADGLPGIECQDRKVSGWIDAPWFSTTDFGFRRALPTLARRFPTPSKWERSDR